MNRIALLVCLLICGCSARTDYAPRSRAASMLGWSTFDKQESPWLPDSAPDAPDDPQPPTPEPTPTPEPNGMLRYSEAYALAKQTGKPMLVLVTAEGCKWCVPAKEAAREYARAGQYVVAHVHYESDMELAIKLASTGGKVTVPCWIRYAKVGDGSQGERQWGVDPFAMRTITHEPR